MIIRTVLNKTSLKFLDNEEVYWTIFFYLGSKAKSGKEKPNNGAPQQW